MARMTDEQADDRGYSGGNIIAAAIRRSKGEVLEIPRIDPDDFEAEQNYINELILRDQAEMQRIYGTPPIVTVAPWNDNACGLCRGRGVYHLDMGLPPIPCPDCHGTGAESVIVEDAA